MPTYQRFEDLPVWQAAADLYEQVEAFLQINRLQIRPSFRDQLERAALSVSNNIAEGFERGTNRELLSFLYIARGSAAEVRSMLILLSRRSWDSNRKAEIMKLTALAELCSRQLRGWADSLQNSEISGPRNLNEKTRREYQEQQAHRQSDTEFQVPQNQAALP